MPLPASVNKFPVHISIVTADGQPAKGVVHFDIPVVIRNIPTNVLIGPGRLTATLDNNGEATISLPSTNDPDNLPVGWTYTATVVTDVWNSKFDIIVPIDTVGTIEFATFVTNAVTPSLGSVYLSVKGGTVTGDVGITGSLTVNGKSFDVLNDVIHPEDPPYNAVGDGVADDTTELQAAITAAGSSKGTVVLRGSYRISGSITIPNDVTVKGASDKARVLVPAGFNFPAFIINSTRGRIKGIRVVKDSGAAGVGNANAVQIIGENDSTTIEDVTAEGMATGFYAAGQLGTIPGTIRRLVLINCRAINSAVFGFEFDECDGVDIAHCSSNTSGLDGIKLRRKAKNISITGGYYNGAQGGDGIDTYAGGDSFVIQGTVFSNNTLNGLVIKNDDLNRTDAATYGYVRTINLMGLICQNNGGSGVACHRSSGNPDDPTEPLVSSVNIIGGQFNGNTNYGLYLNARRVTVTGIGAARNGLDGVYLEPTCQDVDLIGIHSAGNSLTTVNTRDGIHVAGHRIRLIGGSIIGTDPDGARDETDIYNGTKTQRYGLYIDPVSTKVDVFGTKIRYNLTAAVSDTAAIATWAGPVTGLPLRSGWYITPGGTRATLQMAANVEYAVPIYLSTPGVVVRMGMEITVAGTAGTVIRMGIRDNLGYLPGPVLGEATIAADSITTGIEATTSIFIDHPGIYWLVAVAQNTGAQLPTVRAVTGLTGVNLGFGALVNVLGATPNGGFITAANIPAGSLQGTYTVSNRAGSMPLIALRA